MSLWVVAGKVRAGDRGQLSAGTGIGNGNGIICRELGGKRRVPTSRDRTDLYDAVNLVRMIHGVQKHHEPEIGETDHAGAVCADIPAHRFEIANVPLNGYVRRVVDAIGSPAS